MSQLNQKIPFTWWFILILFLEIWPMFVGPFIALNDPTFLGGEYAKNLTVGSIIYAARNIAVGLAFFISIYLRNAPMLFILIVIRLITDVIDAPAFFAFRPEANLIGLIVIFTLNCYLPALFGLRYLWRQMAGNISKED